jgi:hypothetical protein
MRNDDPVLRDLAALAADDAHRHAGPHVERAVTEAFTRQRPRRWLVPAAAAAALLIALSAAYWTTQRSRTVPAQAEPVMSEAMEIGIVQWARVQVPREYLPQLGIAVVEPGAGAMVLVEVAIGEDGRSHAVRIVR